MSKISINIKKLFILLGIVGVIAIVVSIITILLPIQTTQTSLNSLVKKEQEILFNNDFQMINKDNNNQMVNTLLQPIVGEWKREKINKLQELDSDFNTRLLENTLDTKYLLNEDFNINEVQTKKFYINNNLTGNNNLLVSNEAIFEKQIIVNNDVTINLDQTNKLVVEGSTKLNLLNAKMTNKFNGNVQVGLENNPNNLLLKTTNTITKDLIVQGDATFQENVMVGTQTEEKTLISHANMNFHKNVNLKNTRIQGDVDFGDATLSGVPNTNQINNISPIIEEWVNINEDGIYGGPTRIDLVTYTDSDHFFNRRGIIFVTLEWGSHGKKTFFWQIDWDTFYSYSGSSEETFILFDFYQYDKRIIENVTYQGIWRHTISVHLGVNIHGVDTSSKTFFNLQKPTLKETTLVFLSNNEDDTLYNTEEVKKDLLNKYTENNNKIVVSAYNLSSNT